MLRSKCWKFIIILLTGPTRDSCPHLSDPGWREDVSGYWSISKWTLRANSLLITRTSRSTEINREPGSKRTLKCSRLRAQTLCLPRPDSGFGRIENTHSITHSRASGVSEQMEWLQKNVWFQVAPLQVRLDFPATSKTVWRPHSWFQWLTLTEFSRWMFLSDKVINNGRLFFILLTIMCEHEKWVDL